MRLNDSNEKKAAWKKWGPYLSERQWGTVREDYSASGNAWDYFTHDQARSRAYRWGEDGLGGISDDQQHLCFALALWNGQDAILKERLYGLTNSEANHGEDVKEYYFYLDSTPTHSYMKYLYKYPHAAFPYGDLIQQNRQRGRHDFEYQLIDTGVFDQSRYFDVFVEYAKASPEDILVQITVWNRGPAAADLHVLPTLWFRNHWTWDNRVAKPGLWETTSSGGTRVIESAHEQLGRHFFYCDGEPTLLFTENETNNQRVFGVANSATYVKDGINDYIVHGQKAAVNSEKQARKRRRPVGDLKWLKACFRKLLLNFTWWVNRKDRTGRNVFEGGFLGLDNIGVFDRSAPLPTGGYLEQADGTAWMALFADNMLEIAIELAMTDEDYVDMVQKFLQHDTLITSSLVHLGEGIGMWDEEDGFFYDVLRLPDGSSKRLKVRSMVGLLPLCAGTVFEPEVFAKYPEIPRRFKRFLEARPALQTASHDPSKTGVGGRRLFAVLDETKLRRVLAKVLDENEFLGPHGIRSLSRYHADHPYVVHAGGQEYRVPYTPAESDSGMFGGNSNWRGPVWMPVNMLLIRALTNYYAYYGNAFTIECPTGSGHQMNLYEVAEEITRRLTNTFLKDERGRRPIYGHTRMFQEDPHWRDLILFYEYFHGDNGAGLGASHQTGWTGIIARAMHMFSTSTAEEVLQFGQKADLLETESAWGSHLAGAAVTLRQ